MVRPLIPPRTLRTLRQLDESAMPSTCQVYRAETTYEAGRRVEAEPVAIGSPFPCRVTWPGSGGTEEERGERLINETMPTVSVPLSVPPILGEDEIDAVTIIDETEYRERFQVTVPQAPGSYSTSVTYGVRLLG